MKKLLSLLLALTLVGCSTPKAPTPTATPTTEVKAFYGEMSDFGTPKIFITFADGAIATLVIDEIDAENNSKIELGDAYAPDAFAAGTWAEQVKALETFIIANGIDAVQVDEAGLVTNEDLKTSVTINVSAYVTTVNNAVAVLNK